MAQLPLPKTPDIGLSQILTRWKSLLDPVLAIPQVQGRNISGIQLKNGVTVINHGLGRLLQGWVITDITASAQIYRSAPFSDTTLTLTSNSSVTINLEVF